MAVPRRPFIIVPLYIYPTDESWEPLFSAASSHPEVHFVVVVNPANGPGSTPLPDANYVANLARLSSFSNVWILGYVYCSYGNRSIAESENVIRAYQAWNAGSRQQDASKPITISGIFFDEVPSSLLFVQHMAHLASIVREAFRLPEHDGEPKPQAVDAMPESGAGPNATVVYNPGVVIDPAFYQDADYVVAFENVATQWDSPMVKRSVSALPAALREKSIAIAHSVDTPEKGLCLGEDVAQRVHFGGQFITTMAGYTDWCPNWINYVTDFSHWRTVAG